MNNAQFRALFGAERKPQPGASTAAPASALGSRQRSSIPMTPRNVKTGVDFAKQLAASRQGNEPPTKKFRSSAAPKGAKLPSGYTDRVAARGENDNDELVFKLNELEAQWKEGTIEQDEYDRERNKLVGGDAESTHLVKGLDWRLLDRARRGEDVLSEVISGQKAEPEPEPAENDEDLDAALDDLNDRDVQPLEKERTEKKGTMAPPPQRKSRDELLAQLRASRKGAKPVAPALGSKFRKIGQPTELQRGTTRKEIDEQGREVLIIVGQDGTVKRKVRKAPQREDKARLEPSPGAKALGMEVPEWAETVPAEEEDDDIFADAGMEYDPLGDESNSEPSSESESEQGSDEPKPKKEIQEKQVMPSTVPKKPIFDTSTESAEPDIAATLLSTLQARAASDKPLPKTSEEKTRDEKLAKLRERMARDDEDLDLDFGGSWSYDLGEEEDSGKKKRKRNKAKE